LNWKVDLRIRGGFDVVKLHHSLKSPACLVRLNHVASRLVNANDGSMRSKRLIKESSTPPFTLP